MTKPMRLADAPGGEAFLSEDPEELRREESSSPRSARAATPVSGRPKGTEPKRWFADAVLRPDFGDDNFYSDEVREPGTLIKTNAARALGSNATAGHI